jgi:hypothetical protein
VIDVGVIVHQRIHEGDPREIVDIANALGADPDPTALVAVVVAALAVIALLVVFLITRSDDGQIATVETARCRQGARSINHGVASRAPRDRDRDEVGIIPTKAG